MFTQYDLPKKIFVLGNNGFACSTSCPVTCNVGEMYCPGVQDPVTGN